MKLNKTIAFRIPIDLYLTFYTFNYLKLQSFHYLRPTNCLFKMRDSHLSLLVHISASVNKKGNKIQFFRNNFMFISFVPVAAPFSQNPCQPMVYLGSLVLTIAQCKQLPIQGSTPLPRKELYQITNKLKTNLIHCFNFIFTLFLQLLTTQTNSTKK